MKVQRVQQHLNPVRLLNLSEIGSSFNFRKIRQFQFFIGEMSVSLLKKVRKL